MFGYGGMLSGALDMADEVVGGLTNDLLANTQNNKKETGYVA